MSVNADDQSQADQYRRLLVDEVNKPTPRYAAYLKYQSLYNNKVSEQQSNYAEAQSNPSKLRLWPITGKQYSDEVNDAMNKWVVMGYKREIENAINILKSQGVDINSLEQPNN